MKNQARWLVALMLAAVACKPERAPLLQNSATIRLEGDPDVLNPMITTLPAANYIAVGALGSMVFEQLLRYDPKTGQPTEPGLATGYPEVSADHRAYTFTIREGVKWHDGQPFSVDDVLFTI